MADPKTMGPLENILGDIGLGGMLNQPPPRFPIPAPATEMNTPRMRQALAAAEARNATPAAPEGVAPVRPTIPAPNRSGVPVTPPTSAPLADFITSLYASQKIANEVGAALPDSAVASSRQDIAAGAKVPMPANPAIAGYFSRNMPMAAEPIRAPVVRPDAAPQARPDAAPQAQQVPDLRALTGISMPLLLEFLKAKPQQKEAKQPSLNDMIKAELAAQAEANRKAAIAAGTPEAQAWAQYNAELYKLIGQESDPLAAAIQRAMEQSQGEGT